MDLLKKTSGMILVVVFSILAGAALLIGVYRIPVRPITDHVRSGYEVYLIESSVFSYAEGYKASILDNYTEILMLLEAIYPSENPLADSMLVPHIEYKERADIELSLAAYLNADETVSPVKMDYPRYWHGYLVILKPLLFFLSLSDIRMLGIALQLILIFVLLRLMRDNGLGQYCPAIAAVLVLWNPATTGMCFQYYPCFFISILAAIVVLLKYPSLGRSQYTVYLFYFLLGILTSYFDYLAFPLAVLCLLLLIHILLSSDHNRKCQTPRFFVIPCTFFWGLGYLGQWLGKWFIGSLITGQNLFNDGMNTVRYRTSGCESCVII